MLEAFEAHAGFMAFFPLISQAVSLASTLSETAPDLL